MRVFREMRGVEHAPKRARVSTDGAAGLDAYEVAVTNGFAGTEAEWLASLAGADGAPGTTIAHFQVEDDGTTGQLTTGTATVLAGLWGTPSINQTGFTWTDDETTLGTLEVDTAGIVEFDLQVSSWNNANNRHELHAQILKNGTDVIIEASNYASRNNTQDEGDVDIHGFKDAAVDGDVYQIRVFDVGVAATVGSAEVAGQTYFSAKLYT